MTLSREAPVLATICARRGSKGIPGKNLQLLQGRPLIAHALDVALDTPEIDAIAVSTDDDDIAAAAEARGVRVPFRRPAELATDEAPKLPVIRHAASWVADHGGIDAAVVVDLDVTVPLRTPAEVGACIRALQRDRLDVVVTVYEAERNPYFNMIEMHDGLARLVKTPPVPLFRRQDAPRVFSVSPAVFCFRRSFLEATDYIYDGRVGVVEIPRARAIDIDEPFDLRLARLLASGADS